MENLIRP